MFVKFNFTEKIKYILSIKARFQQFDEHGNEALLEKGVNAFDAVSYDFYNDRVLGSWLFVREGFLEYKFEELNGEFIIKDDGFLLLFVAHGMVQFEQFRLKYCLETLFVGRYESVFSFEQVNKFKGNLQFNKLFDVVMVLIDSGSDAFD